MTSSLLQVAEVLRLGDQEIPLLGRGHVWVEDSIEGTASIEFTQWIIREALRTTSPGQLEVIVFDDALTGLAAPFDALNATSDKMLRAFNDPGELKSALRLLRDHIQGVKTVVRGRTKTLNDYRRLIDYPVESYRLVIISTDVSLLDEETQNDLATMLKAGASAGVSFVIHSMSLDANPFVMSMCSMWTPTSAGVNGPRGAAVRGWQAPTAADHAETATSVAKAIAHGFVDPIPFAAVEDTGHSWRSSSREGLTFAVGRYGESVVEITIGDEMNQRHNVLITGAVGQGKSNLISVVLHSLCQRYSPDELELYLLDFKEGVTLQPFAQHGESGYLPHARALGLEADREFGVNVLRHLHAIYKERLRVFRDDGVQNLRQYRMKHPDCAMPRIVLVVDEFQMLFADRDRVGEEAADLLVGGVRLFRAAGIHVVLASQTIGGNLALMGATGESLFAQIPIRLALKNSLSESHATLGPRNDGATLVRSREAIVNVDYGAVSSNRKTSIAFADDAVLVPLRARWWQSDAGAHPPPYAFRGDRARTLADDHAALRALVGQKGVPQVLLGATLAVDGRCIGAPLSSQPGRNLAVVGAGASSAVLASGALALAHQTPPGSGQFVILPSMRKDRSGLDLSDALESQLTALGHRPRTVAPDGAADAVRELSDQVRAGADGGGVTYVLGFDLESQADLTGAFEDLVSLGPAAGVHLLGAWSRHDSFRAQVGYGGEDQFDVKVATQLDSSSVKQFMGDPLLDWHSTTNRALVWDKSSMQAPVSVIPYSTLP